MDLKWGAICSSTSRGCKVIGHQSLRSIKTTYTGNRGIETLTIGNFAAISDAMISSTQRVLGLTWRPRRMSFFVDQKPEEILKNDGNTI